LARLKPSTRASRPHKVRAAGMWFVGGRMSLLAGSLLAAALASRGAAQSSSLPVVPGAVGFGMNTRAAYGCGSNPSVIRVTTLNDSGTGSLRAALTASGPRVVVFEISGYIDIRSDIEITNPCLTVAGQTAPTPGITIRMVGSIPSTQAIVILNTHDVLFQHVRIRPGDTTCNSGLIVWGTRQFNVVLDHMSFSWAQDENLSLNETALNGGNTDVTVWRSITSEGLFQVRGSDTCTGGGLANGHGILIDSRHVAIIQSLFAHNPERNPNNTGDGGTSVYINNVVYDWNGSEGFLFGNRARPWQNTSVGNRFIVGPETRDGSAMFSFVNNDLLPAQPGNQSYRVDNTYDNAAHPGVTVIPVYNSMTYDPTVESPPPQAPLPRGFSILASTETEEFVLANAGARPAERDAVDTRIVNEVRSRTGSFIRRPSDVGGYPTLAVHTRTLTLPSNLHTVTSSRYTNLEVWLQAAASVFENRVRTPPTPSDLRIIRD
jgi:hypothetical protein